MTGTSARSTEMLIGMLHPGGPHRFLPGRVGDRGRWVPGDPRLRREVLTPKEWKAARR